MKRWMCIQFAMLILPFMLFTAVVVAQAPQPGYVPPDVAASGLAGHNEYLAVIETNCTDVGTAIQMRNALTRSGALISIITSPGRMLAWVPPAARDAVAETKLESAAGSMSVLSVSYSSAEFDRNHRPDVIDADDGTDSDEAIVAFLDFIKKPLTEDDKRRIAEREMELEAKWATVERMECARTYKVAGSPPYEVVSGLPAIGGEEDPYLRSTTLQGLVAHSSFFMESASGTGTWDWDPAVYQEYRNFYIVGLNYWVSFAARYGKTVTTYWRNYSPYSTATQTNGEPTTVREQTFVPLVLARLVTPTAADAPPEWDRRDLSWCWWYNNKVREAVKADESICGFIAYNPSGYVTIWPHAELMEWSNDNKEGIYFVMDTQYGQAGLHPFRAPLRNVVAHEIGHLWGCPDEYSSTGCGWSHHGMANINCPTRHPAYGRPGYDMVGWDGIMCGNYIKGNSIATPVHTGVISVAQTARTRIYSSSPFPVMMNVRNDDAQRSMNQMTPIGLAVDFDYSHKVTVPLQRLYNSENWYFDHWLITRKQGTTTTISSTANVLHSSQYASSFLNPVTDIQAVYTNSTPDIFVSNTTLEAHLAPIGTARSPDPGVALKWRNAVNMDDVKTIIEWEAYTNHWEPLTSSNYVLAPFKVPIGHWTGVLIHSVPEPGGIARAITSGTSYRFRIKGEFNTIPGVASQIAEVTTRPNYPKDTVYCYNQYLTDQQNVIDLGFSDPGFTPLTIHAAVPITGRASEFSWYVPQNDTYLMELRDVNASLGGECLTLRLRVREGSNFNARLRIISPTNANAIYTAMQGDVITANLGVAGKYTIMVESDMSENISYNFVDPSMGYFGFGEYELTMERTGLTLQFPQRCPNCVKVLLVKPFPGEIIMTPHPKFDLFTRGINRSVSTTFNLYYQVPPGYSFLGFGGNLGALQNNPSQVRVGANMPEGEYEVYPIIEPISSATAELVVIYPEGPTGPFELRSSGAVGSVLSAEAKPPVGYDFVGWGGDTTGTTNPMPVTLWRSKRLIAHYRAVPCQPEPMTAWNHQLLFRNARQNDVTLEYGMAAGAGDGLESGQTDLPPIPPPTAVDIRWINIPGSQGSPTDLRAIKSKHTFQGRVQTGGTAPVDMTWNPPAASPNADYTLKVQGTAASIDMRTASSFKFVDEGTYVFTIEVKEGVCPEPTKENEIVVTPVDVRDREWPCVELRMRLTERSTGEILPYYNPYFLRFSEKLGDGSRKPMQLRGYTQMDSVLIVRLCGDPANTNPGREIEIINDNDDDTDQRVDTILVPIPPPIPTGTGDPERFVFTSSGEWEMVSTPLLLKDSQTELLFSDPLLRLYGFDTQAGGYTSANAMEFGRGYWMKSDSKDAILIGLSQPSYQWTTLKGIGEPYGYGWNMIGSMFKPIVVSAIEQTPAGGLKAIYGWDPSVGYVVPTSILPGKGYWVRVDPGTKLKMTLSTATGGSAETTYHKMVNQLDIASVLTITDASGAARSLYIAGSDLSQNERDILALPVPPPSGMLDARTGEGSSFIFNGENLLQLRGDGQLVISMQIPSPRIRLEVRDENDQLLQTFTGAAGENLFVDVSGTRTLKLRAAVQPAIAEAQTLGSNYPNPFRLSARTYIPYRVTEAGSVRLAVFDLLGRELRTLVNDVQALGSRLAVWDGRDERGELLPAGVYIYRLQSASGSSSRTLTIIR